MLELPDDEIQVWTVPLDLQDAAREQLAPWLAADERQRAARFVFDRDRNRFIVGRGALRVLLAQYSGCTPDEVTFRYGPHGKPALENTGAAALFFNVSHTHELALVALRRGGEIGVDIERLRPIAEAEAIARRYFTPREHTTLQGLPPADRAAAFFRCWTRKEAMLKAIGVGLSFALNDVEVTLTSDVPARLLSIRGTPDQEQASWRLHHLDPAPDYVGAVAVRGGEERIVSRRWTPDLITFA